MRVFHESAYSIAQQQDLFDKQVQYYCTTCTQCVWSELFFQVSTIGSPGFLAWGW